MTTKSTVRNNGKVWIIIETKTPIDLSKLDPSTVEPIGSRGFRVLARSTADNFLFDYTKTFYLKLDINRNFEAYNCDVNKCPPIIEKANPYVSITGLSSKSVRIVAKAFTHLIKLCGGKEQ